MNRLDLSKVTSFSTVWWSLYFDLNYVDPHYEWVRYIVYPVSQANLDRVCKLNPTRLMNSMGDLYLRKSV